MVNVGNSPDRPRHALLRARSYLWALAIGCEVGGFLGGFRGEDNSYDFRNYHYYVPYALFHDRIHVDYGPAQVQSYLNPLSFVPFYLLATHAPAFVAGILQGIVHGLVFALAFAVARVLFGMLGSSHPTRWAFLCAALGTWGPIFVGFVGGSCNDILMAQLVVLSVLLVLRWWRAGGADGARRRGLVGAGLVIGIATGLKLTASLYAVAAAVGMLFLADTWRKRLRIEVTFAGAAAVGFLLTAGWWMAVLQARFDNPFFPFFNGIFQSPDYLPINVADKRFLPSGWAEHLTHPLRMLLGAHRESGSGFRDSRYLLVALLGIGFAIATGVRFVWRRLRPEPTPLDAAAADVALADAETADVAATEGTPAQAVAAVRFLLCLVGVSYVLWQYQFSILRYLSPLEVLAPTVALVIVYRLVTRPRLRAVAAAVVALAIVVPMRPIIVDRMPWSGPYVHAEPPRFEDPSQVLVVIAHNAPWSYLLPSLQPEIRVLGLRSNLTKPDDGTRLQTQMREIVRAHTGSIYLLSDAGYLLDDLSTVSSQYDLVPAEEPVYRIPSRHQSVALLLCPVRKVAS